MRIREGTTVVTAGGRRVGEVTGFVIDPGDDAITHLVVDDGSRERLALVAALTASPERVVLAEGIRAGDLVPLEEERFVPLDAESTALLTDGGTRAVVPYGPFDPAPPAGEEARPGVRVMERFVPEGAVAVAAGTEVSSADGRRLGEVREVIVHDGAVTGFVVARGMPVDTARAIPIAWVRSVSETGIRLAVRAATVERIPAVG